MSEQQHPDPLEQIVEEKVNEFQQNFHLSDETARLAAEDSAAHTVPSPSAEAVELDRIKRAQELLGEP
ncbi:MAG: hypothetical protein WAJ85_10950 [Candidatus Baltobacteraceae bacterium]|jgi:hypothetical protein